MPRTPPLGAILGLCSAAWLVTGVARADAPPSAPTSQHRDAATPDAPSSTNATPPAPSDGTATPDASAPAPGLSPAGGFDAKTHFSLSWVRLPGAEDCVSAKKLSRAVEERLHRPALGAPSETDVEIEGFIEKTDEDTFHAVVTITDARGRVLGKRELEKPECRDMDDPLALAIALMIDPDAAFAPTAAPAPVRPHERAAAPKAPPPKPRRALPPSFGGFVSAGIAFGFGNMPETAEGAWVVGAVVPPTLFPVEVGAHLFLDQTVEPNGVKMAFSRATLDLFLCPLDLRVDFFGVGACAGVQAGTLTTSGVSGEALEHHRQAIVDVAAHGHLDLFFLHRYAVRLMPALGVPLIRDHFEYYQNGVPFPAFPVPAVYGEASVGFGVKLP